MIRPQAPAEGRVLRMLRHYRALTQPRLAEISGVSRAAISDFERGEREARPERLRRLLGALDLPDRAWRDTVRHVEWIDWLSARAGPEGSGLDRAVEQIAESACRDLERHLVAILRIVNAWTATTSTTTTGAGSRTGSAPVLCPVAGSTRGGPMDGGGP